MQETLILKVDVEGHEMSVLRGAKKAIRDKRIHLILLEYGDKVRATLCWAFTRSILAPVGQISSRL